MSEETEPQATEEKPATLLGMSIGDFHVLEVVTTSNMSGAPSPGARVVMKAEDMTITLDGASARLARGIYGKKIRVSLTMVEE